MPRRANDGRRPHASRRVLRTIAFSAAWGIVIALSITGSIARADSPPSAAPIAVSIGMEGKLTGLVLPGSELEPTPVADRQQPVVVRIDRVYKHGDAHRYDLAFFCFEPGSHDLRNYLRRKDATSAADLPPIPVVARSTLPPGQIVPRALPAGELPSIGGYRTLVAIATIAWVIVLLAIAFARRGASASTTTAAHAPLTLAARLQPLIERGLAGELSTDETASLERLLLGYWRHKLGLVDRPADEAYRTLRRDAEAGPMLAELERWLHRRPGSAGDVDVAALLRPYQHLPADILERSNDPQAATQLGAATQTGASPHPAATAQQVASSEASAATPATTYSNPGA